MAADRSAWVPVSTQPDLAYLGASPGCLPLRSARAARARPFPEVVVRIHGRPVGFEDPL